MCGASCTTTPRVQGRLSDGNREAGWHLTLGQSICTVDTSASCANDLLRPGWSRDHDGEESKVDREPEHEMNVPEQDE